MADPVVHLTAGVPDSGTGNITTLGQTLLDGAQLTQGAMADAAASTDTATASQVALFKRLLQRITTLIAGVVVTQPTGSNLHTVVDSGTITATVSGTATVSQATGSNLHAVVDSGTLVATQGTGSNLHTVVDSGTLIVTQATGTNLHVVVDSGTISGGGGGVVTQGTGTNLHTVVDSGAITANAGTNLNTSTLALESGGNLASAAASLASIIANTTPVAVTGFTVTQAASSTVTRPADTTAYASGDLVANSVTAGSVTNLQFTTLGRVSGGAGVIVGAQLQKSTASVTNAAFRLHLFNTAPTYTSSGDNTAISTVVVASGKGYLGYIDITAMVGFSDVAWGSGAPDNTRGSIPYVATAQIIYGLLEARGAYTPGNAEVFTVVLDALQD